MIQSLRTAFESTMAMHRLAQSGAEGFTIRRHVCADDDRHPLHPDKSLNRLTVADAQVRIIEALRDGTKNTAEIRFKTGGAHSTVIRALKNLLKSREITSRRRTGTGGRLLLYFTLKGKK
jgi:hypothetical protein